MKTFPRSASALALAALAFAAPPAQAAPFTFVGGYPGSGNAWSYIVASGPGKGIVYANWQDGRAPLSAFSTDIHVGTSTSVGTLASAMDYASFSLRSLYLDAPAGVSLTGGLIDVAGGGSVVTGSGSHTVANALALNADGAGGTTTFSVASGGTLTSTGLVSGSGGIVKAGGGRLDLTGANLASFTGPLRVDGGTLATTLATANAVALQGGGGTLEIVQNVSGTLTVTLPIGMSLAKSGTGTLRVGSQALTGTTTVSGGGLTFLSGSTYESDAGFSVASGGSVRVGSFDTVLSGATYANAGTLQGTGEVDATLANAATGQVNLAATDALTIGSGANTNAGLIGVAGGALTIRGTLANTGQISGHGSFDFGDGLAIGSGGSLAASGGLTDVFGKVTIGSASARAGIVVSAGGGTLTFHDDVVNNGLASTGIQTDAGSRTVFLGSVSGAGPFTGAGAVEFDGDLRPGNSPARVTFSGETTLGGTNDLVMELGGLAGGSQYDQIDFEGRGHLGGALDVVAYGGFVAGAGQSFDLLDGTWDGTFASILLPSLSGGLTWDTSALYTTGVISVRATPEPSALAALGLGAVAFVKRRRKG